MKNKSNISLLTGIIILIIAISINIYEKTHTEDFTLPEGIMQVHYLDVGQADSALVVNKDKAMLIDTGNADDYAFISNYLNRMGIKRIDILVLTHPHEDHIGSGAKIIDNYGIGHIVMPKVDCSTLTYIRLLEAIENNSCYVKYPNYGEKDDFADCNITYFVPSEKYESMNNNSVVTYIKYGKTSFMFMGDAEREEEHDLLKCGFLQECDVLKIGHHGSNSSTSYLWLRTVNPKYAVISCGEANDYGHPHDEVLSRLRDLEAKVFRTDTMGTVIAESDGENISVETIKQAA